jgi:multidrug resistance efflux pump
MMAKLKPSLATGVVVLTAIALVGYKYWDYTVNPWTRDGQVRAQVIQITPRVSGPITRLPIEDNQFVRTGDVLFAIDPRTFEVAVAQARANVDNTRDLITALEKAVEAATAQVEQYKNLVDQAKIQIKSAQATLDKDSANFARALELIKTGDVTRVRYDTLQAQYEISQANLDQARVNLIAVTATKAQADAELAEAVATLGAPGEENAQLRVAQAALRTAELNLEFSRVVAPVDGYVTNLDLRLGDQAVANQPALALIDVNSFWVHGFFRETLVEDMRKGDRAVITLMSYPGTPLEGRVDSIGWGISQDDGSTGYDLLPTISPTFEWIRLAQRIPVRVHLKEVPDPVQLRVGTTASVLVMTGTASDRPVPALPSALQ